MPLLQDLAAGFGDRFEPASRIPDEVAANRLRAVAHKYPFLVPPIYDKSALSKHETLRALWFEAGETLKRAKGLVCMGYSLPESDLTMKQFLRTSTGKVIEFETSTPPKMGPISNDCSVAHPQS